MEAEPPNSDPPKRKRRWFQFSLRTLLAVVTIVAVDCAVCLPILKESQRREAVRRIVATMGNAQSHRLAH